MFITWFGVKFIVRHFVMSALERHYKYTFYLLISLSFRCVLASYMIDELAFKGYYHNHAITSNKDLMKRLPSLDASSDQLLGSSCGCCAGWLKECRSLRT